VIAVSLPQQAPARSFTSPAGAATTPQPAEPDAASEVSDDLFDRSAEYDAMLDRGLRLSGENRHYFAHGRIDDLQRQLPAGFAPRRILDFGCGLGDTTKLLAERFPTATAVGIDTAANALEHARLTHGGERVRFEQGMPPGDRSYDLCFVNGVFHHIEPFRRLEVVASIRASLVPGGWFAFFENNPWNPGTRLVMRRIPFDRDARPISAVACDGWRTGMPCP